MSASKSCRLICVEDEALICMLIEDMLLELGVEVVGRAARLDDALELARKAVFDAAVLDINVGGVPSYPVADVLRARGIPFIFCTGYGSVALPERFRGCQVLEKPFDLRSFQEALGTLLADTPCEISAA
jgi:CheY-like chemotaxis protein